MRKFKVLVLAVALIFASLTLAQAQVGSSVSGSKAVADSGVNYNHYSIEPFGVNLGFGELDLVGGVAGALGGAALGGLGVTALDTLGGAAVLGGIGALVGGLGGATLGAIPVSIALLPFTIPTAAIGFAAGMTLLPALNADLWTASIAAGITGLAAGIAGDIGSIVDFILLPAYSSLGLGLVGSGIATALVGGFEAFTGGILPGIAGALGGGLGALAGGLGGLAVGFLAPGAIVGGLVGASLGIPGAIVGGLGGALVGPFGPFGIGAATIGGLGGAAAGFGLGNTMDAVIQAGVSRGDSAPAKPAASVADFM
jgi:hypothetical protein